MTHSSFAVLRCGAFSFLWRPRTVWVCLALTGVLLLLTTGLLGTGTLPLSPQDVLMSLAAPGDAPTVDRIVWRIRLPRVLTAVLVGAALGMAGSVFQSITRNALGSPDVIGFTTGAATGAIVQIILFNAGPLQTALAAVIAGIVTAAIVFLLSVRGRTTGSYRLVLIGIGVGAILSGVNMVLLVMGHLDQAVSAQIWLAGSLNTRTWAHVLPAAAGALLVAPVVVMHARRLELMEMGDEAASQLGISTEHTRLVTVMAAVALTALATAAAGPIAFVALAAPQLARRLTGSPQVPVMSGAMMGAVLLLAADLLSQHLPLNLNMPIGHTTGFLGGLYLVWLLTRKRA